MLSATRRGAAAAILESMSTPLLLAYTVTVLLIAYRLADVYLGGRYVCPGPPQ